MPRPPKSLLLALDIGSSSLRAALFTERGERILPSTAARQYSLAYTPNGGAELDPNELLRAARSCVNQTLRARAETSALRGVRIVAVCGSAIWHSLLGLDRKQRPTTPIFTWADSRSGPDAVELRQELSVRKIQSRTGCMLRAPFWPAKLRWLRRTDRALFRRTATWVSPATWIFDQLFGAAITSHSMASGTGLYNQKTSAWDPELCELCRIRVKQLSGLGEHSLTSDRSAKELRRAAIFSAIGDGAAGNLGSGAIGSPRVAINVGTSAAVRIILPKETRKTLPFGLFRYVVDQDRVVVGGAVSNGGNLRRWCLRELQLGGEAETESALSRKAAADDALTVLPFWTQERAPTWPEGVRGTIAGLTPATTAADILRAATTSTFYRLADIYDQLKVDSTAEVIVSGGILHSPASLKILADCLGRNFRVSRELESSLRGAAVHALEDLAYEVKTPRPGRTVHHRAKLAKAHRLRRAQQHELERRLR